MSVSTPVSSPVGHSARGDGLRAVLQDDAARAVWERPLPAAIAAIAAIGMPSVVWLPSDVARIDGHRPRVWEAAGYEADPRCHEMPGVAAEQPK